MCVGHAQLFALVNVRGAAVHVQQHAERLGAQLARLAISVIAPTGDDARLIMIAEEQAGPAGVPHGLLLSAHSILKFFRNKSACIPF